MMHKRLGFVAAVATLLFFPAAAQAIVVAPAPVPPAHQTVTYTYKTFLGPSRFGIGPFGDLNQDFGTLKLTFNADGIISGTYKPEYGTFSSVTGGRNGKNFHLELGSRGQLRLLGHFTVHGIAATAQTFSARGNYWQLYGDFVRA